MHTVSRAAIRRCYRVLFAALTGVMAYSVAVPAIFDRPVAPAPQLSALAVPVLPAPFADPGVVPTPKPLAAMAAAERPVPATASERECLAEAVYFEARGEDMDGQRAIAEVVARRASDPRYPKTICGVVYQGAANRHACQFSFACDGKSEDKSDGVAWKRALAVADDELTGAGRFQDITFGATHFHTTYVNPSWSGRFARTVKIGNHIFYRQPGTKYEARNGKGGASS